MTETEKTATPAAAKTDKPAAGNPLMKYGIMIGVVLVMAAVGYFVALKFVKPATTKNESSSAATGDQKDSAAHDEKAAPEKKESSGGHEASGEHGAEANSLIFEVENVIVNPAGTGGTRYLSVSVGFEVEDDATKALLESRQPQIRDALITILGSKDIEQLTDMKQKEIARLQIKKRVMQLLSSERVSAVYFTNFVIQ